MLAESVRLHSTFPSYLFDLIASLSYIYLLFLHFFNKFSILISHKIIKIILFDVSFTFKYDGSTPLLNRAIFWHCI